MTRSMHAAALAALMILGGCSSGGASMASNPANARATGPTIHVSVSGGHLVGPDGRTLYSNTADTPGHLICTGSCLTIWPPVLGRPAAGAGVSAGALGTVQRGAHTQLTFDGHPLYEFASDTAPGDTKGTGIVDAGGTWHPAGAAATKPNPGGGYGGGYGGH